MINQIKVREKLFKPDTSQLEINASLWLNKYLQDYVQDESRRDLIKEVAERLPEPSVYPTLFTRWQQMLTEEYHAQTRRVRVKGRMIVGLGNESTLETSICLHRTYGMPYIPGSALKGLAASYAHQRLDKDWQKGGTFHNIVFGNTEDAGHITFLDAWYVPASGFHSQALHPDVITVHHEQYYQNTGKAPSDSDDPNPVSFLSATGIYLLALAAPAFQQSTTRWIDLTFQILANALTEFGIGAKTSSGYGRMEFLDPPIRPLDPERKIAEEYKSRLDKLKASDVAGQIGEYHRKWQQLTSVEARKLLAQAIIDKVHLAGREKVSSEKNWYQEIIKFLSEEK